MLEWTGIVPHSFHVEGRAVIFQPWAIELPGGVMVLAAITNLVIQLVVLAQILVRQRRGHERAQAQIQLLAWHLAQMLPARRSSV